MCTYMLVFNICSSLCIHPFFLVLVKFVFMLILGITFIRQLYLIYV